MKDHGLYTNDNSVISLIEQVKREALLYAKYTRRDSINNNLVSYKVTSLYNAAKTRAKANNIAFSLSTEWIASKLTNKCEATGLSFVIKKQQDLNTSESNPYAPSIDKIDPSKGYTEDNCQMVIIAYNKFKSDYKETDILNIAKSIIEYKESKQCQKLITENLS